MRGDVVTEDAATPGGWSSRFTAPESERNVGFVLVAVAVVGMLVAVVGAVVGWQMVGTVNTATTDTLDVTVNALGSVEDTIDVADGTVSSTSEALSDLETTLLTLSEALRSGATVIADTGQLTETSGPALNNAALTLRQLESVGGQIDGFLSALSNVPFSPDFDPDRGLGATFGRLAGDIEPLDEEFTTTAASLEEFEGSLTDLQADVDGLAGTIGRVNDDLLASKVLLDQYRDNVAEAQLVAARSQGDLGRDQTMLRLFIVLAGASLAMAQVAPLWIGLRLIDGAPRL